MKNIYNTNNSRQRPRFALNHVFSILMALVIGQSSDTIAADAVFTNGFEALPIHLQLDCEREGYPCSLDDVEPEALDRAVALLTESWSVRRAGTLTDVRTFLENQSDVIVVGGNYRYVSFRVEGMMPVIFDDLTTVFDSPPDALQQSEQTFSGSDLGINDVVKPMEVVGGDINGDGTVDQKDIKRAFVLAPYEWQFAPNDESGDLATRLKTIEPYADNVVYKSNPNQNDANITLEDWLAFDNYDLIVASTHGSRQCQILPDLSNQCEVWISSGIVFDFLDRIPVSLAGITVRMEYDEDAIVAPTSGDLSILLDFWRHFYQGSLENKLVTFSACETGNAEGGALAAAMGGDDFVMGGWTEVVPTHVAFPTMLAFYEELAKGLATGEAFDNVASLGLFPALNAAGIQTSFELFSPNGDDVRIFELPRLMFNGETMIDGTNIQQLVTGAVADQSPDSLNLTIQVNGVTVDSKPDFKVRYRVDNQDVPGVFDLNSATLIDNNYRYEVEHDIPLGFPLMSGEIPIEVIVELPEGGDSRFSVNTFLAGCYFTASVSGDTAAFFDGPAQFEIGGDGSIDFRLRNSATINGDIENAVSGAFSTGPSTPLTPGAYNIDGGSFSINTPAYAAIYIPGFEGADCPSCGGTVNIDAVDEEQSISGNVSVTLVRTFPPPTNGELPTILMDVDFTAAFGSVFDGSSPYVQCSILYADD